MNPDDSAALEPIDLIPDGAGEPASLIPISVEVQTSTSHGRQVENSTISPAHQVQYAVNIASQTIVISVALITCPIHLASLRSLVWPISQDCFDWRGL
jgi:hypothetical protein